MATYSFGSGMGRQVKKWKEQEQASKDGKPVRPGWESMLQSSGAIKDVYQLDPKVYDQGALQAMNTEALRAPGTDSIWRQLQQQKLEGMGGRAAASAQSQAANAQNQLAMRGGLRGGAAERLAGQGALNALQARQGVLGQGVNLDIQDESNRLNQIGAANQANLAAGNFMSGQQQFNIGNALTDVTQKRYSDLEAYKEQMRGWAAERTARATPSGGGGKK